MNWLIADGRLEQISQGNSRYAERPQSTEWGLFLTALAALIVLIFFVARIAGRNQTQKPIDSSLRLFWSLCKAHDLNWSDRWLLWRITRHEQIAEPAALFLDPRCLDRVRRKPPFNTHNEKIVRLGRQLFRGIEQKPDKPEETLPPKSETPKRPVRREIAQSVESVTVEDIKDIEKALDAGSVKSEPPKGVPLGTVLPELNPTAAVQPLPKSQPPEPTGPGLDIPPWSSSTSTSDTV